MLLHSLRKKIGRKVSNYYCFKWNIATTRPKIAKKVSFADISQAEAREAKEAAAKEKAKTSINVGELIDGKEPKESVTKKPPNTKLYGLFGVAKDRR